MQGVMNNGRRETKLGVWSKSAVCKYSKRASAGKLALDWNLRLSAVHVSTPGLGVVEGCRFVWELGSLQHDQHQHQSAAALSRVPPQLFPRPQLNHLGWY